MCYDLNLRKFSSKITKKIRYSLNVASSKKLDQPENKCKKGIMHKRKKNTGNKLITIVELKLETY